MAIYYWRSFVVKFNPHVADKQSCTAMVYSYFQNTDSLVKSGKNIAEKNVYRMRQQEIYSKIYSLCNLDFRDESKFNAIK